MSCQLGAAVRENEDRWKHRYLAALGFQPTIRSEADIWRFKRILIDADCFSCLCLLAHQSVDNRALRMPPRKLGPARIRAAVEALLWNHSPLRSSMPHLLARSCHPLYDAV